MFQGNKPVLILPAILMVVMFIGGYMFLKQTNAVTNEDLQHVVELEANRVETGDDTLRIDVHWDWTTMPSEGLDGYGYIGVALMDKENKVLREDVNVLQADLELAYGGGEIMREIEGTNVDNGVIFAFKNEVIDNRSYGNIGRATVVIEGEDIDNTLVRVHYLHTWTDEGKLVLEDALFQNPTFEGNRDVPYWVISR